MEFNPSSIAIGVGLTALLTAGALTAVFKVIPATQDRAAENAVAEAVTAEALCSSDKSTTGAFAFCSREELATGGYLPTASGDESEDALAISVSGSGSSATYSIQVVSKTGTTFQATHERQTPTEVG
ncbi:hypothetical protein [Glutamicibacter ardleyensis]|uniref:hypothetical protein n=1 Tax=Glutamicibacter ardleyensis TaxID=225894 RepID=UPI003FD2E8C7